jgi:uncharacterized membrane protein YqaE (UPF0057 family)
MRPIHHAAPRLRRPARRARGLPHQGMSLLQEDLSMAVTITDPIKIVFAVLLPPLGVFLEVGFKGHFWLNILLTILGFVPGIIHALYVILKH